VTTLAFDPAKMTPEEFALCDLEFWCEYPTGIKLWECQRRWIHAIQWGLEDSSKQGVLILGPAACGKTSKVLIPAMRWCMARDRGARHILAGNKDDFAYQVGAAVMRPIEKNPALYRDKFGLAKGDIWSKDQYYLQRENDDDKDPSLLVVGVGSEVQSQRADILWGDDLVTRRNSASLASREKISSWFWSDFFSRLDPSREDRVVNNKIILSGHRGADGDLYAGIEDRENWVVIKDRAIVDEATKTILAPESGKTYEDLCRMRDDDPVGFELLMQQRTVAQGIFVTRSHFERLKCPALKFHLNLEAETRKQFDLITMSLDPAFSVSKWARPAVLIVWGLKKVRSDLAVTSPDNLPKSYWRRTILYGLRDKMSPEQLMRVLEGKIRIYRPDRFFYEANQGQALLGPFVKRSFPELEAKTQGIFTVNPKARGEDRGRLDEEMAGIFESMTADAAPDAWQMPIGCAASQAFTNNLEEEIVNYPNWKYRDALMSTYINEKGAGLIMPDKVTCRMGVGVVGGVSQQVRRMHGLY
jgi:hypothetical protein